MATNKVESINWSIENGTINFFGAKGAKHGKSWIVNAFLGIMCEVEPDSMLPQIRDIIADDVKNGNGDKIAQILMAPRQAVVFYLEGVLTKDLLKQSVEGPGFIDVPNVQIDDRVLTVRILEHSEYTVATADADGVVV